EKRNEALTGLLAQSPTRSHNVYEHKSPIRQESRRTRRPNSMAIRTKAPSSPGSENYKRPQSVLVSPAQSSASYFSPRTVSKLEHDDACNIVAETSSRKTCDSDSVDSSCLAQSPARKESNRSSTASHTSTS